MSKRSSPGSDEDSQGASTDEPIRKKRLVVFEPVRICSINATSDIDAKVLAVQHYKLSERFRHKERQRDQLQKRVEQLESRQAQDDAMLCIINRSWNRFDEDVRILLQRFDAETALEGEIEMEYEGTKNFLAKLSHWENDEIEDKLKQRVEFSRRAIAKMVQVFDHITQRNEKIANLIASCPTSDETNEGASTSDEGGSNNQSKPSLSVEVAKMNAELSKENTRLQNMVTKLQSENHSLSVKVSAQEDELTLMETRQEEMTNSLEEVKYQLEKSMRRECKLDFRLAEYVRKAQQMEMNDVKTVNANGIGSASNTTNVSKSKLEELEQSLEMQTELATSRLQELQEMLEKNKNLTRQLETLKLNLKHTPSEVVKNSTEYMALQSQYSALYMEATQMRQQLEVARTQMAALRTAHAKQIEVMESEECLAQERMRDTVSELEEQLSQVRKEYEMLRLEFEQNLSANEQSGPVNKEIRMLLTSFKTQNEQLKQESSRFKRKWKEAVSLLAKCNKELEGEKRYRERCLLIEVEEEGDSLASPDQEKNSTSTADSVIDGSALEHGELAETDNDVSGPPHKVIQ
ncbi:E3 ubiquitin-protein ligase Bre1 [Toxocara canis]|uniref:E3 ubiquitin protein ligase n=1 Tax=Toxocara canis TaxID=6265 RepID=A0A0B2UPJ6_TOXCA|nr:E3 ubiquitin-protein ligase Bre1 [Toxocara canis]